MPGLKNRLVVFVSDKGFVLPTIKAALQVMQQPKVAEIADAMIYLTGVDSDSIAKLNATFAPLSLRFVLLDPSLFMPDEATVFHGGHVPPSTLGRLALAPLLPEQYDHIVYLDGDIEVIGDIFPLVSHDVAPGKLAAVTEALWLSEGNGGAISQKQHAYLARIGIRDAKNYFNAGVLAFRRETWLDIAPKARDYFFRNSELCVFHDQSALNAICQDRREILPPWYNFITGYASLGYQDHDEVRIVHFNGGGKPWQYFGPPWRDRFYAGYEAFPREWPILKPFWNPKPHSIRAEFSTKSLKRRINALRARPWNASLRRRRFETYLKETKFAF